jgi:prephenate dehydrogenase
MVIGIVGLGLIGGSLAKSIKAKTTHTVLGYDKDNTTLNSAKSEGAIDEILAYEKIGNCDILILALTPENALQFINHNINQIKPGMVVMDVCGVKTYICENIWPLAKQYSFTFIGGHPMAGIERFGYANSLSGLFDNASMILTPEPGTDIKYINLVSALCNEIGFGTIKITTPEYHDKMIAYTSQLAHIVSSAYIKSPTSKKHQGFSAGSFKDMTRVATLNEQMWAELFLLNQQNLILELDNLIDHLMEFKDALKTKSKDKLLSLLKEGRICKQISESGEQI